MRGIIDRNLPIQGVKMLTDTARKIYEGFGMTDKIALLDSPTEVIQQKFIRSTPCRVISTEP